VGLKAKVNCCLRRALQRETRHKTRGVVLLGLVRN
jgi:hypothetical protein